MILPSKESDLTGTAQLHASSTIGPPIMDGVSASGESLYISHKSYSNDFVQAWHEHPCASIDFVLQGGGSGVYGSREVLSSPGRVEFFRDGLRHKFRSDGGGISSMHIVLPRQVLGDSGRMDRVSVEELEHTRAVGLAASIFLELNTPDRSSDLAMESLVFEILDEVKGVVGTDRKRAGWLGPVRDAIHASQGRALSLSELAEVAGVSRGHLVRRFRSALGVTPGEYHRRVRMSYAARMLADGSDGIARISKEAGFVDQAHFTTAFKKFTGHTPAAFRRAVCE